MFTVEHIKGAQNPVADVLSRLCCGVGKQLPSPPSQTLAKPDWTPWTSERFLQAQMEDTDVQAIATYIRLGRDPPLAPLSSRDLLNESRDVCHDGLLHCQDPTGCWQPVASVQFISRILMLAHEYPTAGHLRHQKTLRRVLPRFWWPTVKGDVEEYTRSCIHCLKRKSPHRLPQAPLMDRPRPTRPFETVEADFKGLLLTGSASSWSSKMPSQDMPRCTQSSRQQPKLSARSCSDGSVATVFRPLSPRTEAPVLPARSFGSSVIDPEFYTRCSRRHTLKLMATLSVSTVPWWKLSPQ